MALIGSVSSPQALGLLMQQARLSQGLSQQQVAAQLGISQGYVSELESGKTSLTLIRIFDIMRLTGMTLRAEIPEGSTGSA